MSTIKNTQLDLWEVFIQGKSGNPHVHAGSVHASDKRMALQNARDTYTRRGEGTSIWVVPSNYITGSEPSQNDMFFEPSQDKIYRHPTFYVMPDGAKQI
jgi:ring-1,2-phenylacetyl-CoA epoxidase subunit PaaB